MEMIEKDQVRETVNVLESGSELRKEFHPAFRSFSAGRLYRHAIGFVEWRMDDSDGAIGYFVHLFS
jgi:hypothetical protein